MQKLGPHSTYRAGEDHAGASALPMPGQLHKFTKTEQAMLPPRLRAPRAARKLTHLVFTSRWFEKHESEDLTFRCDAP